MRNTMLGTIALIGLALPGQTPAPSVSEREKSITSEIRGLRSLLDNARGAATKRLAREIRELPPRRKLGLASSLTNLSTEGDSGREALQEVANTLAAALKEHPVAADQGRPAMPYVQLAQLARYEHVEVSLDDPQFAAAISKLEADDAARADADFTLSDLQGKTWSLRELRGKVVLVNFWATWCGPCRKEMPDLETMYDRFKDRGLVILAISDEDSGKVAPFVAEKRIAYPVLLDPGRKVNDLFRVDGVPKSYVYDRAGKLAAQAIDMRTARQFLEMLAAAGLK